MTSTILLYDPTAPARHSASDALPTPRAPKALAGAVIGFIDNSKPNFAQLVDDLAEVLLQRFGVARVIKQHKRTASVPASPELLDTLARDCDLVIAGAGD
jgi:hypothetical protein